RKLMEDELEERVAQRTAELQAANRELEAFSYSVSHDLRAPLRAINAFSSMVLTQHAAELSPEAVRLLEKVRRSAVGMGQLIDDLLALSRVGRAALKRREVDMNALVREVLQELDALDPARNVHVQIHALPPAYADPGLVKQVYFNLLSNAYKFTRSREEAR